MAVFERVRAALERVERIETRLHAWAFLDPEQGLAEARVADQRSPGPLTGLTFGVKDIFDTADQPTEYGSPIYAGYRPRADASSVALVRAAGGIVLGKTATAEFAYLHPAATTNPHRPSHTPGGSSSGSAAAVAAGLVDIALGTQTAGSVIRPASFCGVFGFKPSAGSVDRTGVKPFAEHLDTVGWFAQDVDLLDRVHQVLTSAPPSGLPTSPPRFGRLLDDNWAAADESSREAVLEACERAKCAGAEVVDVEAPVELIGLSEEAPVLMAFEAARAFAWEHANHTEQLSSELRDLLVKGAEITLDERDRVLARRRAAATAMRPVFSGCDVLLLPAAAGEAPAGLASTGDPRFARAWTLLGCPALAVPGLLGSGGLPVGVQLVAAPGADRHVLQAGLWLGAHLPAVPQPELC